MRVCHSFAQLLHVFFIGNTNDDATDKEKLDHRHGRVSIFLWLFRDSLQVWMW